MDYVLMIKEEIKRRKERHKDPSGEATNVFGLAKDRDYNARRKAEPCGYLISVFHPEWPRLQYVIYGPLSWVNDELEIQKAVDLLWDVLGTKEFVSAVTYSDICNVVENIEKRVIIEGYNKTVNIPAIRWKVNIEKRIAKVR